MSIINGGNDKARFIKGIDEEEIRVIEWKFAFSSSSGFWVFHSFISIYGRKNLFVHSKQHLVQISSELYYKNENREALDAIKYLKVREKLHSINNNL